MSKKNVLSTGSAMIVAAYAFYGAANAQANNNATPQVAATSPDGLQEIIVTAQRRSENVQKVPISIAAVSAETLQTGAITSTLQLSNVVPALVLASSGGVIEPYIRGIGTANNAPGNELPVAVYIDNVYIASANSNLIDLADVNGISVLKGPQGTLFGRNAVGGVIQISTKTPKPGDALDGNIGLSFDNFETLRADFYIGGGLSSDMGASLSGVYSTQGRGWGRNQYSGEPVRKLDSDITLRGKFVFMASDSTKITAAADYAKRRDSLNTQFTPYPGTLPVAPGYVPQANPWDTYSNFASRFHFEGGGVSLTIDHDANFAHLISISSYRRDNLGFQFDIDATPTKSWYIDNHNGETRTISQEFQINSSKNTDLKWTLGAYYFKNTSSRDPGYLEIYPAFDILAGGPGNDIFITTHDRQIAQSFSVYGQATQQIFQNTNLTVGLRYTTERRTFSGFQTTVFNGVDLPVQRFPNGLYPSKISFKKPTWRLALDHAFTPDILAYASYSRGFKSGGYNTHDLGNPPYLPETLDAYEVGLKTELFDRHLRLNSALFYYDRKNVQVNGYVGRTQVIYNGAGATSKGIDVDFDLRAAKGLDITGGFVAVDSTFSDFANAIYYRIDPTTPFPQPYSASAKGNQVPFAPKLTATLGVKYAVKSAIGDLTFNVNDAYNSGYFTEPDNHLHQTAFHFLSASTRWASDNKKISITFWGRNLLNKVVAGQMFSSQFWGFLVDNNYEPRTFGVSFKGAF